MSAPQTACASPEPLWTVRELCSYLQRSARWVHNHRSDLPPAIRLPGGGLRWEAEAVRAWARGEREPEDLVVALRRTQQ